MSSTQESPDYVILGAGVVGLTTAWELKDRFPDASITIVAKFLPGDRTVEYCSPWAGANWCSMVSSIFKAHHPLSNNFKSIHFTWMRFWRVFFDLYMYRQQTMAHKKPEMKSHFTSLPNSPSHIHIVAFKLCQWGAFTIQAWRMLVC